MPTPNWSQYLLIFVLLAIGGFALVIVSGFWHILALLILAAAVLMFWLHSRKAAPK